MNSAVLKASKQEGRDYLKLGIRV